MENNNDSQRFTPEPEAEVATPPFLQKRIRTQKQPKAKVEKPSLKRRAVKLFILLAIAFGLLLSAVYGIDYFFDRNTINWQTPIKLQKPIYLTPRTQAQAKQVEVVPTAQAVAPVASPAEVKPHAPNMDKLLASIYQLESSSGKNDGCKTKGMFNGFGYGQNANSWNCFSTFSEVENKVRLWFEKRVPTMGLSTAICYYNSGHKVADCPYYQSYLKIQ